MHVVQNCFAFFPPTCLPQGHITVNAQTGNYWSNNNLLVPMLIHSFVPHTVHGWNLLPESVVNLPLQQFKIATFFNPVHNILIASLLLSFCLVCSVVFLIVFVLP